MLRWIVGSSLRFRLLAVALGTAVLVAGANQSRQMPVDSLPSSRRR
jgi:Cu/Ag efflux pump CusA